MRKLELLEAAVRDIGLPNTALEFGALIAYSALWPSIFSAGCESVKISRTLSSCPLPLGNLIHPGVLGSLHRRGDDGR
jgi:hypothetical protein